MTTRPHILRRTSWLVPSVASFVLIAVAGGGVWLGQALAPTCTGAYVDVDTGETHAFDMPLSLDRSGNFSVTCPFIVPFIAPRSLAITPDECLEEFTLNGARMDSMQLPLCDYDRPTVVRIASPLHRGGNVLQARFRNTGGIGGLSVTVAPTDRIRLIPMAITLGALMLLGTMLTILYGRKRRALAGMLWIIALGIGLRMGYASVTPASIRGHDTGGHIDYIRYVADHWSVPPVSENWEAYQPPLYYFVNAPLIPLGKMLGWTRDQTEYGFQIVSIALSILTLLIGAWIGSLLFHDKKLTKARWLFTLLLAVWPALIFFAPRINNDALFQLWTFLAFALLIRWWQFGLRRDWCLLALSIGLGILTKLNMAPFVALALFCLLLKPGSSVRRKTHLALILIGIVGALSGPYVVMRSLTAIDEKGLIVGNYQTLTNFVENSPGTLTIFNPVAILQHPYNDPFSDIERRAYVWEYFYRSAFTGEFSFGPGRKPLAITMLLSGFFVAAWVLWNVIKDTWDRNKTTVPLWAGFLLLLLAQLVFRWKFPYSSSQDFRYSIAMLIPCCSYVAHIASLHTLHAKMFRLAVGVLVVSMTAFMVSIIFAIERMP